MLQHAVCGRDETALRAADGVAPDPLSLQAINGAALRFPAEMAPEQLLRIPAGDVGLEGLLARPGTTHGLVIVAGASGTGRCPRHRTILRALHQQGLATLVVDLLTPTEKGTALGADRWFQASAPLGERLAALTKALAHVPALRPLVPGLLGINVAAGAALSAAAHGDHPIAAVVCLGGRPDRDRRALHAVRAPTLLISAERDAASQASHRQTAACLEAPHRLVVLQKAAPRFENPGAIDHIAVLAADWFARYLAAAALGAR